MGSAARYRPMSPSGSRMMDPMRASTGTVQLSSSYDAPPSRHGYPSYPSDVPYLNSYEPRLAREPRLEAQPVSSKAYRDSGHSTKLRTEYAIRPRQRSSTTTSVADIHYTPGRLDAPVSRTSPVIMSDYHRSPSPLHTQERYLVPASSPRHHRRHPLSHTDYASDTGRLDPHDRVVRARMAHGAYRGYEPNDRWRYPPTGGLRKGEDIDDYDAYSYTNPREQFEKDSAARLRNERSAYRRDRPLSLTGIDDPQLLPRKEPRPLGPPPSQRGFDKLTPDRRMRHSAQGSVGSDIELSRPRRRSRHRAPVSLHQDHDEGYSSYRDDYEDAHRRYRRHRRPEDDRSSRQSYDDHAPRVPSSKDSAVSGAGTGLGTAGLASGYSDDFDYDLSPRTDRHSPREIDDRAHRRRSRSRRPSRRRVETDSDAYSSDEDLKKYRREPSARRKPSSETSGSNSDRHSPHLAVDHPRRRRSHSRHRKLEAPPTNESGPKELSGRQDDPKRAESTTSKEPDAPPKGILKPPREKFPEEPNPVREGVAPLKDAHKKGIPPGARWTKVDRRLVNPAALEAGQERFEERPDYVIVLRVLSKEEIQAYAVKTQEIRDARYHEYIRERRRRREEDRRRGHKVDDFSSDDEDEDDSPLAIEGPAEPKFPSRPSNTGVEPAKAAA